MKRRSFLCHAGALAGSAALGQLGILASHASRAAASDDYKALVCIFLVGGNDTNNTVVPIDSAGYANYAQVRGALALPQAQLLPLQEAGGVLRYGLHPALPGLQSLWTAGNLAVVANVGTLVQPLTKTQYLSSATQKPATLFSHIDQQHEWQASISDKSSNTGWGGRLSDQFNTMNAGALVPPMISTGGNNLFVTGAASQALVIPTSGSFGLSGFASSSADAARRSALVSLLGVDRSSDLTAAAQDVMSGACEQCHAQSHPHGNHQHRNYPLQRPDDGHCEAAAGDRQGDRGSRGIGREAPGVSRNVGLLRHAYQSAGHSAIPVLATGSGVGGFP
jgi:uncharacterized protein (DUF1501 family)